MTIFLAVHTRAFPNACQVRRVIRVAIVERLAGGCIIPDAMMNDAQNAMGKLFHADARSNKGA
jgi:hypothetical protein